MTQQKSTRPIDKKVYAVAHYFMYKNQESGRTDFTLKKLQKLLFYSQAWMLVLEDCRLFDAKFKAWVHGAAIPELYKTYRKYDFGVITEKADEGKIKQLSDNEKSVLDNVWSVYGKYDADYLEALHRVEEPWRHTRGDMPAGERSDMDFNEDVMKSYYSKKHKETQASDKTSIY